MRRLAWPGRHGRSQSCNNIVANLKIKPFLLRYKRARACGHLLISVWLCSWCWINGDLLLAGHALRAYEFELRIELGWISSGFIDLFSCVRDGSCSAAVVSTTVISLSRINVVRSISCSVFRLKPVRV